MEKFILNDIFSDICGEKGFSLEKINNVSCTNHIHMHAEFVIVTEGALNVLYENEMYNIHCGEGMFFMPYEIHGYITSESNTSIIIVFNPNIIEELCGYTKLAENHFVIKQSIINLIDDFSSDSMIDTINIKSILYALFSLLNSESEVLKNIPSNDSLCRQALYFIDKNYNKNITLKSAADALNCHYAYLSRVFSENTGYSFTTYLNRLRTVYSLKDLKNNNMNITDVAERNGFSSLRNYNRSFMKYMHLTPSEYRKKIAFH